MKKIFILFLFLIISFSSTNNGLYLGKNDIDLFNEIISTVEAKPVEYGVKASFETKENPEKYSLEILNKLGIKNNSVDVIKDNNRYCVEFNASDINGYIETTAYDNYNIIVINITQKDDNNGLPALVNKVKEAIGKNDKSVKYFQYLKAEIQDNNIEKVNENVKNLLKKKNASNIETVDIDNGYSTVAYTKRYEVMKDNGKWIDFNYAVCNYSSGNYIIIGTPVIITTY